MKKIEIIKICAVFVLLTIFYSCATKSDCEAGLLEANEYIHDFGSVKIGEFANTEIVITNKGNGGAYIIGMGLARPGGSGANPGSTQLNYSGFSIDKIENRSIDPPEEIVLPLDSYMAMKSKEEIVITIKFEPTTTVLCSACLEITNVSLSNNPLKVELIANNQPQSIDVTPNPFDFEKVDVGESKTQTFTIENVTDKNQYIKEVILDSGDIEDFSIDDSNLIDTLSPAETTSFTLTFKPTKIAEYSIKIAIILGQFGSYVYGLTITGAGVEPQMKILNKYSEVIENGTGVYNYIRLEIGKTSQAEFTIKNLGSEKLQLTGSEIVSISGENANLFAVESNPDIEIEAGNETTFIIEFAPIDIGNFTATVTIENSDSNDNPYVFVINGRGGKATNHFDFNGDGFDDVLVSAINDDDGGTDSGCVFLFYGRSNWDSEISASKADVKFIGGDAGDIFGISVSNAGDVNKDGFDDVIIGAVHDDDGGADSGCAFIFFGSLNPLSEYDSSDANVTLIGEDAGDWFGWCVNSTGDFNNDGIDDVIIGAPYDSDNGYRSGCAFVIFGKLNLPTLIDAKDADIKLIGEDDYDQFGYSVDSAGDFNNDGYDDIIIGACYDTETYGNPGCAFIYFGKSVFHSLLNTSDANVKIIGEDPGIEFGVSVSSAGDINGDNYDDVIVGAHKDDDGGNQAGCAFVFLGSSNPKSVVIASEANAKFVGEKTRGYFGHCVSTAGDINKDGFDDVIVGEHGGDSSKGNAYIFFGSSNPTKLINASNADIKLIGWGGIDDVFGASVSIAGDLNNDSISDVIVSAQAIDNIGLDSGCAFIYFGSTALPSTINAVDADVMLVGENAGDTFSYCVSGGR